jgi:hypothetical protein
VDMPSRPRTKRVDVCRRGEHAYILHDAWIAPAIDGATVR